METKRVAVHGGSKEQHVRAAGLHKRRLFNFALVRPAEVNGAPVGMRTELGSQTTGS